MRPYAEGPYAGINAHAAMTPRSMGSHANHGFTSPITPRPSSQTYAHASLPLSNSQPNTPRSHYATSPSPHHSQYNQPQYNQHNQQQTPQYNQYHQQQPPQYNQPQYNQQQYNQPHHHHQQQQYSVDASLLSAPFLASSHSQASIGSASRTINIVPASSSASRIVPRPSSPVNSQSRISASPRHRDLQLKSVGNYSIDRTIGEGSYAKVKLAKHRLTQEKVALKIFDKRSLNPKNHELEKVLSEIQILRTVSHPNLVRLLEVIETDDEFYLALEYASGGELFDYIVAHGRIAEREAKRIFAQIFDAVEYLHSHNIAHRDLKPENILLDRQRNVRLIDFGMAVHFKTGQTFRDTCGSLAYASPEMLSGFPYEGVKVDIWSLGIMLFAMVVGYLPFEEQDPRRLQERIIRGKPTYPNFISKEVKDLIRMILINNPAQRPSLNDIKSHPWIASSIASAAASTALLASHQSDIDEHIVQQMEDFGYDRAQITKAVAGKSCNDTFATYVLLSLQNGRNSSYTASSGANRLSNAPSVQLSAQPSSNHHIQSDSTHHTLQKQQASASETKANASGNTNASSQLHNRAEVNLHPHAIDPTPTNGDLQAASNPLIQPVYVPTPSSSHSAALPISSQSSQQIYDARSTYRNALESPRPTTQQPSAVGVSRSELKAVNVADSNHAQAIASSPANRPGEIGRGDSGGDDVIRLAATPMSLIGQNSLHPHSLYTTSSAAGRRYQNTQSLRSTGSSRSGREGSLRRFLRMSFSLRSSKEIIPFQRSVSHIETSAGVLESSLRNRPLSQSSRIVTMDGLALPSASSVSDVMRSHYMKPTFAGIQEEAQDQDATHGRQSEQTPQKQSNELLTEHTGTLLTTTTCKKPLAKILRRVKRYLTKRAFPFHTPDDRVFYCETEALLFTIAIQPVDPAESAFMITLKRITGSVVDYREVCTGVLKAIK